ncbi:Quinone oxidoreductase [Marinobacterium lacunae]|uniref:Quinone oxidoreductase n=1 Tax=Marinobacterium lacunae TaxID=1232683 RepID=A0A081FVK7_9GAMM|nr:quinone oxidoreductase [Marinobacterium lacunae]KEA62562.1 Quinone oxidoreductase [Marinobacterium lacunae]
MTETIRIEITQTGPASVLQETSASLPPPGSREVRIRQTFIGVNFVDIYFRSGQYPLPQLPTVPGVEATGIVEALGDAVTGFHIGQRVAYAGLPLGSYCSHRNLPADRLLLIPEGVSEEVVASCLLRGMTAHMLLMRIRPVQAGETMLVQAAAGGLGQILGQWAARLGVNLIGTVGSEAKQSIAKAKGYEHLILYKQQDTVAEVARLTNGRGVDYVIDGIGAATFEQSLACAAPFGLVASIGHAAGVPTPILLSSLPKSVGYIRPSVLQYIDDPASYQTSGMAVMQQLQAGMSADIFDILPLTKAAKAQQLLESGQTTGALLLRV